MCFRKIPDTMEGRVKEEAGACLHMQDGKDGEKGTDERDPETA